MPETLFSEINNEMKDYEGKSSFFYRKALKKIVLNYKTDSEKLISDETRDKEQQDKNVLRTVPKSGHLMIFEYDTKNSSKKYVDRCPIAYMISADSNSFIAANLHFIEPSKREITINLLKKGELLFPYSCMTKYNMDKVKGLFLDIAFAEWDTASFIPIEDFFKYEKGKEIPVNPSEVWKYTNSKYKKMFKGRRIYKGYGKNDSDFEGDSKSDFSTVKEGNDDFMGDF